MHNPGAISNLYLNSYMRSPIKYAPESTLMTSPQKNNNAGLSSLIFSPPKENKPVKNQNLSSLILWDSPAKAPSPTEAPPPPQNPTPNANDSNKLPSNVEVRAMRLSASIFMNSTTKFLKGFDGASRHSPSPNQQKNQSPQAKELPPIVYPSKEKIESIARGNPLKRQNNPQASNQPNASQKLQQTLTRNRVNTERSNVNITKNQSRSERSRSQSGSVRRLSRRKERTRELKFLQKRQRSETSIMIKEIEQQFANKNAKTPQMKQTDNGKAVNQAKSADTKRVEKEEQHRLLNKQANNGRTQQNKQDIRFETSPSIMSNVSEEPKLPKREGFKPLFTFPSGELPIETPVKPHLHRSDSNQSDQLTFLKSPNNKGKQQQQPLLSQISTIKEQKSSDIQTKNSIKGKVAFHGSVKEEASTYIHQNPTQVVVCGVNENATQVKFAKNQSTKANPASGISKVISARQIKNEHKTEESIIESNKKPIVKKMEAKNMPLEPIPSTSSMLEDKKSQPQSTISKRNIKTQPKQELPQKKYMQQSSLPATDKTAQVNEAIERTLKKSIVIWQVLNKIYGKRQSNALSLIKEKGKQTNRHMKEASIFSNQITNVYNNLYHSNLRMFINQLKKLSLNNLINKRPSTTQNNSKNAAANIILRMIMSKLREHFRYFKLMAWKNQGLPSPLPRNAPKVENNHRKQSKNLIQLIKISNDYNKNKVKQSFNKLIVFSSKNQTKIENSSIISPARTPPKVIARPSRDYQSQKSTLLQSKQLTSSQISRMESRMVNKKRSFNTQKAKLLNRQGELTKKNKTLEGEVIQRKQKNHFLKGQLEQIEQHELDITLPDCQPLINILADIYSTVFSSTSPTINIQQLMDKHSLEKDEQSRLLEEWGSLALNLHLKTEIAKWQGSRRARRPREMLMNEQEMIRKVMRNYVRERYLWQCVRITAETL